MTPTQLDAIHGRLDKFDTQILNHAEILNRIATLGRDLNERQTHFAKKLDGFLETLAFNENVTRLLTARVQKLENELKEIQT